MFGEPPPIEVRLRFGRRGRHVGGPLSDAASIHMSLVIARGPMTSRVQSSPVLSCPVGRRSSSLSTRRSDAFKMFRRSRRTAKRTTDLRAGYADNVQLKALTGQLTCERNYILLFPCIIYSVTGQLADTPTRGLDNSRSRRCCQKGKLSTQSRRWHPRVVL